MKYLSANVSILARVFEQYLKNHVELLKAAAGSGYYLEQAELYLQSLLQPITRGNFSSNVMRTAIGYLDAYACWLSSRVVKPDEMKPVHVVSAMVVVLRKRFDILIESFSELECNKKYDYQLNTKDLRNINSIVRDLSLKGKTAAEINALVIKASTFKYSPADYLKCLGCSWKHKTVVYLDVSLLQRLERRTRNMLDALAKKSQ